MFRLTYLVVFLLSISIGAVANAEGDSGTKVIETLNAELVKIMKAGDAAGFEGRRKSIAPTINNTYNFPVIGAMATGKNWDKFSKSEKVNLVNALRELAIATYASRFSNYSGEEFLVLSEEKRSNGTLRVKSEILQSDGGAIPLDYVLYLDNSGWKVVDVIFMGSFSELGMRKSEYLATISSRGIDGLIKEIEKKVTGYESGTLQ